MRNYWTWCPEQETEDQRIRVSADDAWRAAEERGRIEAQKGRQVGVVCVKDEESAALEGPSRSHVRTFRRPPEPFAQTFRETEDELPPQRGH